MENFGPFKIKVRNQNPWRREASINCSITRNRTARTIHLHQRLHIQKLISDFGTKFEKRVPMRIIVGSLRKDDSELVDVPYRELLGQLTHIANVSRPDLAFSFSVYSRFAVNYHIGMG